MNCSNVPPGASLKDMGLFQEDINFSSFCQTNHTVQGCPPSKWTYQLIVYLNWHPPSTSLRVSPNGNRAMPGRPPNTVNLLHPLLGSSPNGSCQMKRPAKRKAPKDRPLEKEIPIPIVAGFLSGSVYFEILIRGKTAPFFGGAVLVDGKQSWKNNMANSLRAHVATPTIHPQSLTWNLKMIRSKRDLLFHGAIFRFHVKLQGRI